MKLSTPLNGKRIRDHFRYNFWMYLLAAVLSVFVWNMIYIQTEYRPPENKRIDIYVQTVETTAEAIDALLLPVWQQAVPEMELVRAVTVMPSGGASYMGEMQLMTYLAAGEGDLYLLDAADFKRFAAQGAFMPLEAWVEQGDIRLNGLDVQSGWIASQQSEEVDGKTVYTTERHLYGIPASGFRRFEEALDMRMDGKFAAVKVDNGNDEHVIPFLSYLIGWAQEDMEQEGTGR